MKIREITEEQLIFDNGNVISFDHEQDCCENNYADFEALDDIAQIMDFIEPLQFEKVEPYGFAFGNPGNMFFVPCYSCQNGYYTAEIDIYYNGEKVLEFNANEVLGY